jgi:hypothetical protein
MTDEQIVKLWKNDSTRKAWLDAYMDWGVWLETPELGLKYYKYELPDGQRIIACEYNRLVMGIGFDLYYTAVNGGRFIPRYPEGETQIAHRLCELKEAAAERLRARKKGK